MFGYVTVCREAMEPDDYERFQAYYCGLCHATGKECSQLSRLGLSYDMTFLAIVLASVLEGETVVSKKSCFIHPCKKHEAVINEQTVDYAANMGVMLTYLKFFDDWRDERSIKAVFAMQAFRRGMKKAKKRYGLQCAKIDELLLKLSHCENADAGIDEAADCFAKVLEILFTPEFITDETTLKILGWFGYNIGRWIYVIDAYNDIDADLKNKCYNPFIQELNSGISRDALRERLNVSLTLNLDTAASAYELLNTYKNDGVIRHIIYTSLYARQNKILGEVNGPV